MKRTFERFIRISLPLTAASTLLTFASCTTPSKTAATQNIGPPPQGIFIGPNAKNPTVRLELNSDGTYIAEDSTQASLSAEHVKVRPQIGIWVWNSHTGDLKLTPSLMIRDLRFFADDPNHIWPKVAIDPFRVERTIPFLVRQ